MKDHCPRCISPWEEIDYHCFCLTRCGMRRVEEVPPAKKHIYILESIIKHGDFLVWYATKKYCNYYSSLDTDIPIKLPYVKFDIEAPQLKLYLTFS
jgi:hypothetical protein